MIKRIQQLMDEKGLTVSSLADEIGVKRPTMTHTLSGRNNPSLDVVSKILERFRDINSDWLLFGKEPMIKSSAPVQQELFADSVVQSALPVVKDEPIAANSPISTSITGIRSVGQSSMPDDNAMGKKSDPDKKVSKILIFFSDNTFETFVPETQKK